MARHSASSPQDNPFDEDWNWDQEEDPPIVPYRVRQRRPTPESNDEQPAEPPADTTGNGSWWGNQWRLLAGVVCSILVGMAIVLHQTAGPAIDQYQPPLDFGHFLIEFLIVVALYFAASMVCFRSFPIETAISIGGVYVLFIFGIIRGSIVAVLGLPPSLGLAAGLVLFTGRTFTVYFWYRYAADPLKRLFRKGS